MDTDEVKAKHYWLVVRGENYVSRSGTVGARAVKTWQNNCVRWLRANLPDSGLVEAVLLVPAPSRNIQGRGLAPNDVRNVQRVLKALYNARELVPFLADSTQQRAPRSENVRSVFIVHGHNEALKIAVARLMEKLDLAPIILHEQPNRGRTIIEKFVEHSDVGFAVVLLTGDDRGGLANASPGEYQLRARQNVILELGYFIGRLGRKNVAAIYQHDIEIPSDYSGVLFIPYDDGGVWQLSLAKEIKAAGIRVDMNRL